MQKHILVTVSDKPHCQWGAQFVSSFFEKKENLTVTLFYVATVKAQKELSFLEEPWEDHTGSVPTTPALVKQTLKKSESLLKKGGLLANNIHCKVVQGLVSTIQDIIREGNEGRYDAIVLGRRGIGLIERVFLQGVGDGILEKHFQFPLWLCQEPKAGSKDILLCIDGSAPSLRAVDHIGFILADQPEQTVTLFHIDRGQRSDAESIFDGAFEMLINHGIETKRIKKKIVKSLLVGSAIEKETRKGNYAAVAMGLTGRSKKGLDKFIPGSNSLQTMKQLDQGALILCR